METAGWSVEETRELFERVERCADGESSLNKAFREVAQRLNRKPNSVRNYYYSQLKAFSLWPDMAKTLGIKTRDVRKNFETFEESEVDGLVKHILTEQGKGKSVRAITSEMADGDKTKMLRYQNKYRSIIASRRGRLDRLVAELNAAGAVYRHPITSMIVRGGEEEQKTGQSLDELAQALSDIIDAEKLRNLFMLAIKGRKTRQEQYLAEIEEKAEEIERLEAANKRLAEKLLELKNR